MIEFKFRRESNGSTIFIEAVNLYEAQLRINKINVEYKYVKDE